MEAINVNPIIIIFSFCIVSIVIFVFSIAPIVALKDLRTKIEALPDGLWDTIKRPYNEQDMLIEVKGCLDYSKNKIINANTKIKYFKKIQEYCEDKIKEAIEELTTD